MPGCVSEDDLETSSWFDECDSPRCAEPEGAGSYVGDTFRPASGCYFAVVEQPAVVDCLKGTWFLVNGGSNALTFFKWLADQVSPDLVSMGDTFESEVIDVVFGADGDVEYVFKGSLCSFGPVNCNYGGSLSPDAWDSRHRTSVAAALAAPAYVAGGTRITLVVAQFYDQTSIRRRRARREDLAPLRGDEAARGDAFGRAPRRRRGARIFWRYLRRR